LFIDVILLPKFKLQDAIYVKARFSNNNNSTDASVLHSDVYNYTGKEIPIYTLVCYFDEAQLEIIPGSHKKISLTESLKKKKILHMNPADVCIINMV